VGKEGLVMEKLKLGCCQVVWRWLRDVPARFVVNDDQVPEVNKRVMRNR
jgi:hypothetical protein